MRRTVRIDRPAAEVWDAVGDPARLAEWWPGVTGVAMDGDLRTITLGSGLPMPERIVNVDQLLRRFQYRIESPVVREHLSTLDVLDLGDGTSLAVYSCDADPSTMALIIGGAAGSALEGLRHRLEAGAAEPATDGGAD